MKIKYVIFGILLGFFLFLLYYINDTRDIESTEDTVIEQEEEENDGEEEYNSCLASSDFTETFFSEELTNLLSTILALDTERTGFKYENLIDGFTFSMDEEKEVYAASVNKLPLVLYAYQLADSGQLDLNEEMTYTREFVHDGTGIIQNSPLGTSYTIATLLDYTILYSDNVAYFMLIDKLGLDNVYSFVSNLGYNINYVDNFGYVSPLGESIYAKAVYEYYLSGSINAQTLIENMQNSDELDTIKDDSDDYEVAHKYGYQSEYYNDVSIVFANNPYSLSVVTTLGDTEEKDQFYLTLHDLVYEFNELYWAEKEAFCKA